MSKIVYLEKEDILLSHEMGMSEFGGEFKELSYNCVEKRVVEPKPAFMERNSTRDFLKKQHYIGIV